VDVVWHGLLLVHTDTYAQSAIRESSVQAGSAALKAKLNKSPKYADIIVCVDFIPFAIEISGVWGVQTMEIGRRLTSTTHEPRSITFLRQRISMAVMRGKTPNAFWGHSSHTIVVMFSNNDSSNLIY